MRTQCKFQSCSWSGHVTALFKHCNSEHKDFVKDIDENRTFELNFEDIGRNTFLLCGEEGLYWFLTDRQQHNDSIRRGIFAIDDSEICDYTILIGSKGESFTSCQGPFTTLPLKSKKYTIEWSARRINFYHQITANCMRIVFSQHKDCNKNLLMDFEDDYDESYQCKFQSCSWSGQITALFKHCESEHKDFVKEIDENSSFELNFEDIERDAFLLCGEEGLYWFLTDRQQHKDCIRWGIFAIDDSKICDYAIIIGREGESLTSCQGPYTTIPIKSKKYVVDWTVFYHQPSANCMRIVFSQRKDCNQNDLMDYDDSYSVQILCTECRKQLQPSDHVCINRHCLCRRCFLRMQPSDKVRKECPMCENQYPKDSIESDDDDGEEDDY